MSLTLGSLHCTSVSWGRGVVCASVCLSSGGGASRREEGVFSSNSRSQHLRAGLSLGPLGPAAVWSWPRRPGDERPWRRLRALRLPRRGRGLQRQRLPRMLNPSCPAQEKSRNPSFRPSDLALCLRRPLPRFWPLPHLSLLPPTLECKVLECSLPDHDRPIPRVGTGWTLCHWEARRLAYLDPAPHLSELPHLLFSWDSSFEIKSYAVNAAFRLFVPRFLRPFIPRAKTKLTGFGGGERKGGTLWCVGPRDFR